MSVPLSMESVDGMDGEEGGGGSCMEDGLMLI